MPKNSIDFHRYFNYKRIYDSVHGTIGLSRKEIKIINTRAFQRLRNIKQLGLAHLAFPDADYSRFAHSIGVCHVTGLFLESLYKNKKRRPGYKPLTLREVKRFRLAGLLHDIGHYPFSHTMEHAISKYKGSDMVKENGSIPQSIEFMEHDEVGKKILLGDKEIRRILKEGDHFEPEEIYSIFTGDDKSPLACLISSDLDADRIDYLLRTSYATKLPYGSVDLPYILSQIRRDEEGRICFTEKAVRPLDHFLLSRYFDYQRVAFNKTAVALDEVLQELLAHLILEGKIKLSKGDIIRKISRGEWYEFDDNSIMTLIKDMMVNPTYKTQVESILKRKPPTLLVNIEFFGDRYDKPKRIEKARLTLSKKIKDWSSEDKIDPDMWFFWEPEPFKFTSIGSMHEKDKVRKAIHILESGEEISKPIIDIGCSLMHNLSEHLLYYLRLYAFLGDKTKNEKKRIKTKVWQESLSLTKPTIRVGQGNNWVH